MLSNYLRLFGIKSNSVEEESRQLLALLRMVVRRQVESGVLDEADREKLMAIAITQAVPVVALDGLQQYDSVRRDGSALGSEGAEGTEKNGGARRRMQWVGQVLATERLYAKHEKAMAELARLYATKGLRMMVLKGYGLSLDWPVPNHRVVGDLDIYNFGKWREADDLVAEKMGIKVDEAHEHHTVFNFKGVMVENHYDFINTKAHRDAAKIEDRLKLLAEKDCRRIEVLGEMIYLPSADFNAIFLMRHMGQHFAGEHLNLRQILDWGFFVRAHHEEVDWEDAIGFLKEIGMDAFFHQINAICVDYLGFAEADFPTIERNSQMEQRILMDVLRPEFDEERPNGGLVSIIWFKYKRWWANRWKHQLVYHDSLLTTFATLAWSHLKRFETIKE